MNRLKSLTPRSANLLFLIAALCAAFILASCGFAPLYGKAGRPDAAVAGAFDQVYIGNIPDESGQYLRNALMDRLYHGGRPAGARYSLAVTPIQESLTNLDLTRNSTSTRTQIKLNTTMTLTDSATGRLVLTRRVISINSFNVLANQYDTTVSQEYVRHNLLDDIARQIEAQLSLYFKREGEKVTPQSEYGPGSPIVTVPAMPAKPDGAAYIPPGDR